jgi:hypothetical protein
MRDNELKTLIARLLRESGAAGEEHERLKKELDQWAVLQGYSKAYRALPDGGEPDVLRVNPSKVLLFLGDAKDAENETSSRRDTLLRIQGYLGEYAALLETFKGGVIAIATNNEDAANNWVGALNLLTKAAGIVGSDNAPPRFRVEQTGSSTWIAYW